MNKVKTKNIIAVLTLLLGLGMGWMMGLAGAEADCPADDCPLGETCVEGVCQVFAKGLGFPEGFDDPANSAYDFLGPAGTARGAATRGTAVGIIVYWTNYSLIFLGSLVLIYTIYAGYLYLTSMGDAEKATAASKMIWRSVIGVMIVFAAYAIINTLVNYVDFLGTGTTFETLPDQN